MSTDKGPRDKMVTIRLSQEEKDQLEAVACQYGLNVSSLIRLWLKYGSPMRPVDPDLF